MTEEPSAPVAAEPSAPAVGADQPWVRWVGAVVWAVVAAALALVEVLLLPLATAGGTHIPVAVPLTILANLVLPRVFVRGLGLRFGWTVPAIIWFGIVLASASRTYDADLLISGSDFGGLTSGVFLITGALAIGIGCATANVDVAQLSRRRRRPKP